MGKFHRMLEPGLNILIPILDRIRYVKSLKETAIEVPSQSAITQGRLHKRKGFKISNCFGCFF